MMNAQQEVYKKLDELNISYEIVNHPAVYTIDEMEQLKTLQMEFVVKNLFLRDSKGKEHFLVVLGKDKKADLKDIRQKIDSKPLSFASEERLEKYLKLTKGAVTPFGILNDTDAIVKIVFDKDLLKMDKIGIHPNDNTATVFLKFEDLKKLIEENGNEIYYVEV
ncbi:prolyl-tRNA synthetase associated domain-containing protein [Clostridioides sp. ZZV14-6154]|nr:prolyl-tRNA synthetase associated domain-containing protein [Clostridioides sp. ZZV14-6150]MCC0658957.1 prolyl-tRNA synthetase associated domain-containing protein [Clostridioides sp. ZZV14-6154]MCC0667827.1 prolyl-tRNA synthetase associated domain-containing protein [Clostridioides sp. ZZV14-6153]MCC0720117.1 prolyl-tRNA synthetase associated domain-containing protein [Clostridioides sp. ZZV14-6105]MCC0724632.1 prolyl-tRNA synthetase associated domain-containing protein [Clostridioides sp. 